MSGICDILLVDGLVITAEICRNQKGKEGKYRLANFKEKKHYMFGNSPMGNGLNSLSTLIQCKLFAQLCLTLTISCSILGGS